MPTNLSKDVVSLVQHIELHSSNWWGITIQQLIVSIVQAETHSLSESELVDKLHSSFGITISNTRVRREINVLLQSGKLINLGTAKGSKATYKLSEQHSREVRIALHETEELGNRVKHKFEARVLNEIVTELDNDKIWDSFCETYLFTLIRSLGAKAYELFSAQHQNFETIELANFLAKFPEETRELTRQRIIDFLDPDDADVRGFVLQYLNTVFFIEAGNLSESTIAKLNSTLRHPPNYVIYVDTNFIFSVLELHENPYNSAAIRLMELAQQLPSLVKVIFYALPITLDEAKKRLAFENEQLNHYQMNRAFLGLTNHKELGLSGITEKFLKAYDKADGKLTPDDYFRPYINNLSAILRAKGILSFERKLDINKYPTGQRVVDDILSQIEYAKQRPGYERSYRAKSYKAALMPTKIDLIPQFRFVYFQVHWHKCFSFGNHDQFNMRLL